MSGASRRTAVRALAPAIALGLALARPGTALAHLPTIGLGPVYDGIFHLLLSPDDLLAETALALLCGLRGAAYGRRLLWVLPLAWTAGGLLGIFVPGTHAAALGWISLLAVGALVAVDAKVSLAAMSGIAALVALLHGYRNGVGLNPHGDGPYALTGMVLAATVVAALVASAVVPLRRPWTLVAVRVAGSWIAASGLLLLGWTLRAAA